MLETLSAGSHRTVPTLTGPGKKLPVICRASPRSATHTDQLKVSGKPVDHLSTAKQAAIRALPLTGLAQAAQASIDEPLVQKGITVGEIIILAAPILLYGGFSVYRSNFNQQAKLSDFLFIAAAAVIFLNIFSILILKVRLF